MNRLTEQSGGMPLELSDFRYIHDIYQGAFKAIIDGLRGVPGCIISGLQVTIEGSEITVTEGYYWDGQELFYVPAYSGSYHAAYIPYIIEDFTASEQRTFANESSYNCYILRQYEVGYALTMPEDGIPITTSERLDDITDDQTRDVIISAMSLNTISGHAYDSGLAGFAPVTAYDYVQVSKNIFGDVMIIAAFTAVGVSGKLCTLPTASRPAADMVGYFYANGVLSILRISSSTGEVWVSGASTTGTNYISFTFNKLHTDNVGYSFPSGGGIE